MTRQVLPHPFRVGLVALLAVATLVGGPAFGGLAVAGAASSGAPAGSGAARTATARPAIPPAPPRAVGQPDLGPNVRVFDPSMPTATIQATVDAIAAAQVDNEMGTARYALLFMPGTYGTPAAPLKFQVGYYTEVAGLGQSPGDVVINGSVDVYNRCLTPDNCLALDTFWRSISNLTVNFVAGNVSACRQTAMFWAASQASPMRRVAINGGLLSLMDYCTAGPQFASGGFVADSRTGAVTNGSQQQYLVRDSAIGPWSNGVWNQVFSGVEGAPAQSFPNPPYTTLVATPASREKPYLYVDSAGRWRVFVPAARTGSSGPTWGTAPTPGRSLPLSQFVIARPGDPVRAINSGLTAGRHLLLTPGVYDIASTIHVTRANTVVLGLGIATLTAVRGAVVLDVANVAGVDVAGLMIDAGTQRSPVLMQIGSPKGPHTGSAGNPTALQDVFFRVGGPHVGKADLSLAVNSNHVILDDIWAWRADHGNPGAFGWDVSPGKNGVIVTGNDVTATGLFVEHFKQYNVIWKGERGKTVFFQNELPYDAPNQAAWQHDGLLGWAGYKVADMVRTHELWGGGSYVFTNVDPTIHATQGFEVPRKPGVVLHDLLTVQLGAGTLDHIVNGVGSPVDSSNTGTPSYLVEYPDRVPPTVAVTDSVEGATATGDVTFTFTFSEDVGTSFTTDDVTVTGGTKGAFTRVDATHATLVLSPPASSTGTLSVSVAAGAFADTSGNLNTAAASGSQDYSTVVPLTQMTLPVTFDSPGVDYGLIGFGGATGTLAPDPTDATNTVAKIVRAAGAATFAGTTVTAAAGLGFSSPLPFTATATTMSVRVWSPDAGIPVRLKVEDHADGTHSVETEVLTTVAGAWETLTVDFAHQATGTAAINLAFRYDKASIFFDFNRPSADAVEKTYYVDDMVFVPGTPPPPPAGVITFDETPPPTLTGFAGAEDSTIAADPADATNQVAKVVKGTGSAVFAGTTVSTLPNQAVPRLAFTATSTSVTARVWSPDAGIPVRLKVEDAAAPAVSVETEATTTVAGGWETLTFDFAKHVVGTPALVLTSTYDKVSVFFDFGSVGSGKTYFLDDLDLTVGGATPPPAP